MAAACQKNSYLREFEAEILSCEAATLKTESGSTNGYEVILTDTVLFPEGGGQPDDRGTINDVQVLRVTLSDNGVVHFTPVPLDVGTKASVKVDWTRRFDHMQQHSAQHLIAALAEREYGYETTSWSLGEFVSKNEVNAKSLTHDQLKHLETLCNGYILEGRNMYPTYYDSVDDPNLPEACRRGVPDGVKGQLRVMTIDGIDNNLCCGTHVSSLAHLQAVKIVGTEKGKKGCTNIVFYAGGRIISSFGTCLDIEKQLNAILKGAPNEYPGLVKKLQDSYKVANKNAINLLRELIAYEAEKLSRELKESGSKYLFYHRREGDKDTLNLLLQKLTCDESVFKFLTVGDDQGTGSFLLHGPADIITDLAPKIADILDGKGAGKQGRFQGKANKLSQKRKAEQLIKDSYP